MTHLIHLADPFQVLGLSLIVLLKLQLVIVFALRGLFKRVWVLSYQRVVLHLKQAQVHGLVHVWRLACLRWFPKVIIACAAELDLVLLLLVYHWAPLVLLVLPLERSHFALLHYLMVLHQVVYLVLDWRYYLRDLVALGLSCQFGLMIWCVFILNFLSFTPPLWILVCSHLWLFKFDALFYV